MRCSKLNPERTTRVSRSTLTSAARARANSPAIAGTARRGFGRVSRSRVSLPFMFIGDFGLATLLPGPRIVRWNVRRGELPPRREMSPRELPAGTAVSQLASCGGTCSSLRARLFFIVRYARLHLASRRRRGGEGARARSRARAM